MRIAFPLGSALLLVAIISWLTSRDTVRSARRLERALFDAKAGVRSRTEFLSNVSHELRTPMNGIMGAAQLLRTTELDEEQVALVDVLATSAEAQMALISDLIDLSQLEYRGRQSTMETFEPDVMLRDIADMIRVAADRRRIGFEADWTDLEGIVLRGDAKAFRQIVTNLIANAVKFTETGAVGLWAHLGTGPSGARVIIRVTDTGPGIPEAEFARIFERFYQIDGSVTRSKEGTGLGLAISQELARTMGGRITVSSVVGSGSTFEFSAEFEIIARRGIPLGAAWNAA